MLTYCEIVLRRLTLIRARPAISRTTVPVSSDNPYTRSSQTKAVGIVSNSRRPIREDLSSADFLRNSINDLELISIILDQVRDAGIVISATVDRQRARALERHSEERLTMFRGDPWSVRSCGRALGVAPLPPTNGSLSCSLSRSSSP